MMSNASGWLIQFAMVSLVALFAGPLLSKLPLAHTFPLTLFGLTGPQTIRLIVEATGLLTLWLLAFHAFRTMPENGRGFSFTRRVILPLITIAVIILADKTLRVAGQPLIDRIGPHRYYTGYTATLLAVTLWLSATWLLNLETLHRCFSHPTPSKGRNKSKPAFGEHAQADDGADTPDSFPSASNTASDTGAPPATLGRYKVLKELGRGAMGVVYLGKDPTIQRFVAIKTMRLDETDDAEKQQEVTLRFFREAESTGRLSHPNIVTIYDAGEEANLGYIAMEMLQGNTLKDWSRKPNLLPLDKLIPILATVAEALDYAHQQGVVHRDIKPANIMVTKDQIVKVMDFGIAKMASSSKTQADVVLGTPTYMSPEQIAGKKVDGRSDIFSLGVVLYELLSGKPPFTADNLSALLFAIAHHPYPSIHTIRPDLPPAMLEVLNCALQKDPALRFRRAGEFSQAIRACLQGLAA
ncbi:MAG: serine/threonine-protein kinase [Nitrospira sp.]|jgi:tRNA A-37 threonylcarbamoyl transferase component Bud32|nr:serine/threonine-protein kinase [Nitrospira sp.]